MWLKRKNFLSGSLLPFFLMAHLLVYLLTYLRPEMIPGGQQGVKV